MSQLNLLPEYYVRQRFRNRVDLVCVVLFAVVMAGIMVTERRSSRLMAQAEVAHRDVSTRFKMAIEFTGAFFQLQGERDRMLEEAKESAAIEEYVPRSFLIYMVSRSLPKGTSLLALEIGTRLVRPQPGTRRRRVTLGSKDATEEAPPPVTYIHIQGIAETDSQVMQVLDRLRDEPLLAEVNLQYTRELVVDEKPYREFSMECVLVNGLDVMDVIREEQDLTPRAKSPRKTPATTPSAGREGGS